MAIRSEYYLGVIFDPELDDEMRVTIIATGFEAKPEDAARNVTTQRNDFKNKKLPLRLPKRGKAPVKTEEIKKPEEKSFDELVSTTFSETYLKII
jgi:cell division GTPase FtsZ